MRHKLSLSLLAAFVCGVCGLGALSACAPKFGDGCKNSTDCSVRNDRICDRAQPGGYCTISNCKPGDCGDDGVCVRFRPTEARLAVSYCMGKCDSTRDCDRDSYVCRSAHEINTTACKESVNDALCTADGGLPEDIGNGGAQDEGGGTAEDLSQNLVEVLDGSGKAKFCVVRE